MKNTNPAVDAYIAKAEPFARPILTKIREAFHAGCPELEEKIKWGCPSFDHEGMLGGMSAFKKHVGFGFWKAAIMEDPEGLFGDDPKASPMHIKAATVGDLPSKKVLVAYVEQAVAVNEAGKTVPRKSSGKTKADLDVPEYFAAAVSADAKAAAVWEAFSYSKQKEYLEWVTGAKREATRDKRLAQAVEWISEGKSRNWKYERC
jgi:uncharacterized protein YdeI (YjbR/CyaY-like superfamily)